MMLLTKEIEAKLRKNGVTNLAHRLRDGNTEDFKPVVKFFGGGAATWLITELDENGDTMFGLCDLGFGCPEMGDVSLSEMESTGRIERDRWFTADKTLTEYANEAREAGRIKA